MKIQRVELNKQYDINISCPFCGQLVYDQENPDAEDIFDMLKPCPHTLFFAHDLELEFRSKIFDEIKGIAGITSDDICSADSFENWDSYTDDLDINDAVKFAMYVQAPSCYGSYIGFSPLH